MLPRSALARSSMILLDGADLSRCFSGKVLFFSHLIQTIDQSKDPEITCSFCLSIRCIRSGVMLVQLPNNNYLARDNKCFS
jgi:hypothetical protein